jgi:hypothetical protein
MTALLWGALFESNRHLGHVLTMSAASDLLAVTGILVDALDDDAKRFYEKFGLRGSEALPMKLMVTLAEIAKCVGSNT